MSERRAPNDHVDALLRTLWPAPATIEHTDRRSADPAGLQFLPVPSRAAPRLLVPRRPRRVAAAVLRGYRESATGRTRLMIHAVAAAARIGLGDLLPHLIVVGAGGSPAGVDGYLRETLGRDLHLGVYLGPPRAVQKPVLQLISPQGSTFAFAKLGVTPYTRELVQTEAKVLAGLQTLHWHQVRVPAVLHHGTWQGHQVLVLEALRRSSTGTSTGSGGPDLITRAAVELARCRGTRTGPLLRSTYWRTLTTRIDRLTASPSTSSTTSTSTSTRDERWLTSAAILSYAVERLRDPPKSLVIMQSGVPGYTGSRGHPPAQGWEIHARKWPAGGPLIEFGAWHGDWADWNLAVSGDQVLVWDWELFGDDVPVGFDAVHRDVQNGVIFGGLSPEQSFARALERSAATLGPFAVPASEAALVTLLYTMEIATRYLEVGEHSTLMADLDSWLTPVITRLLGAPSPSPTRA